MSRVSAWWTLDVAVLFRRDPTILSLVWYLAFAFAIHSLASFWYNYFLVWTKLLFILSLCVFQVPLHVPLQSGMYVENTKLVPLQYGSWVHCYTVCCMVSKTAPWAYCAAKCNSAGTQQHSYPKVSHMVSVWESSNANAAIFLSTRQDWWLTTLSIRFDDLWFSYTQCKCV